MKPRLLSILLAFPLTFSAVGQTPSAAPPSAPVKNPTGENADKARKILEQAIHALGGPAYVGYVDMKQQGRGFGFYRNISTGVGVPYTRIYQYPDKERYEFFKQGDWVVIHNGDKGYETTFRGTREQDPKDLAEYNRRRQFALDYILRGWASDKNTAFFYDELTIAGTKQAHKITLTNAKNQSVDLYLDTTTFLPIQKTYTFRDPEDRQFNEESELYDNYRIVQGINTPHLISRINNGEMTSQRFLKSVSYNVGVGDAIFTPPALNYDKMKK